jgi:all-trans-retinol dehydrogenase (NAD+)
MSFIVEFLITLWKVLLICLVAPIRRFFPKKKSVKGELVLITGGASGIGRLLSLRFAKLGANVVIWDINTDGLAKVKKEVEANGAKCWTYKCDISKREETYKVAKEVQKEAGDVTILVNNAGIVSGKKFLETPDEKIEATFNVNTVAHFWMLKAFLPSMLQKNHGHIVTISSNAGIVGVAGLIDYCASKWAVFGMDESLRMEFRKLGKTGMHTTCVCPYYINTGMFDGVKTKYPFLLPILDPDYVADQIITAVLSNQEVLILPWFSRLGPVLRGLFPTKAMDLCMEFTGASSTMDTFIGRQKTE